MPSRSESQIVSIRVKPGTLIHASDPYWPARGRPIRKERIVGALLSEQRWPREGLYWEWIDPKAMRARWARQEDCERV